MVRHKKWILLSMLLVLALNAGCGPSHKEKQVAERQLRESRKAEANRVHSALIEKMRSPHNAEVFKITKEGITFTHDLQKLLVTGKPIVVEAKLEDLAKSDTGLITELIVNIHGDVFGVQEKILMRLRTEPKIFEALVEGVRKKYDLGHLDILDTPNHVAVVKIKDIQKIRRFQATENSSVKAEIKMMNIYFASGDLIDIAPNPPDR